MVCDGLSIVSFLPCRHWTVCHRQSLADPSFCMVNAKGVCCSCRMLQCIRIRLEHTRWIKLILVSSFNVKLSVSFWGSKMPCLDRAIRDVGELISHHEAVIVEVYASLLKCTQPRVGWISLAIQIKNQHNNPFSLARTEFSRYSYSYYRKG